MDTEAAEEETTRTKKWDCTSVKCYVFIVSFAILALCVCGLGIAKLVIGIIYLHDCELQPLLPVYLIVDFCVGLLFFIFIVFFVHGNREEITKSPKKNDGCVVLFRVSLILPLFLFAWFIVGTVWAVSLREDVNQPGHCQNTTAALFTTSPTADFSTTPADKTQCVTCNEDLVNFTFGMVIAQWVLFGVMVVSIICAVIPVLCVMGICSAIN